MQNPYKQKLDKVVDYVHAHLDEELTLEGLAKVAMVSPYHFHRIFRGFFNETLGEFLLRIRMEKAIHLITKKRHSILEIALNVGFHNASSFSRAFKRYFGLTPSDVLKQPSCINSNLSTLNRKYGKALKPFVLYSPGIDSNLGEKMMEVKIVQKPAIDVISLECSLTHESSMGTWLKLYQWYQENKGTYVSRFEGVGIYKDDPSFTPEDKCRAQQCIVTEKPLTVQPPFKTITIPAGTYAVTSYVIKKEDEGKWGDKDFEADEFHQLIKDFTEDWLAHSGHEADNYPFMMFYHLKDERLFENNGKHAYFNVSSVDMVIKLK